MYSILWTVDSLDWQGDKPEALVERVLSNVHNGAVILFHDHNNRSNTIEALPHIIKILKKSGYKFVTLSEWEERVCNTVKARSVTIKEGEKCVLKQCYVDKNKVFNRRAFILGGIQLTISAIFSYRLYNLLIRNRQKYEALSNSNRIRVATIMPQRGKILDRNSTKTCGKQNFVCCSV